MVGIVVVTHGKFAEGILDSLNLIMGPQDNVAGVGLFEGDDVDIFKERIYDAVVSVNTGSGVLVYVDMYGASPFSSTGSQVSRLLSEGIDIRVITGCNLPMLLESCALREASTLDSLYSDMLNTGKESIVELRETLGL